jgi:hypothetical protein
MARGPPAQAAITHSFLSQITEVPGKGPKGETVPLPGKLNAVTETAVDSGNLYVAEFIEGKGQNRLDAFNATSGAFLSQFPEVPGLAGVGEFGLAVGHANGLVYLGTADSKGEGAIAVFDTTGKPVGTWTGLGKEGVVGIAADNSLSPNSGDVFVASRGEGVVNVLKPINGGKEAEKVAQLAGPALGFEELNEGIAVDQQNGDLLVVEGPSGGPVEVFEPEAMPGVYKLAPFKLTETPNGPLRAVSVATDGANGDIYVSEDLGEGGREGERVYQFSSTGTFKGQLTGTAPTPENRFSRVGGIAIDPEAPHHIFIGDFKQAQETGVIDVFGPNLVIPDVTVTEASGVTSTSVTLNGTVNPDGAGEATCTFEYGTSTAYGNSAPCSPPSVAEGSVPVPVHSVVIHGLAPDTVYHFRLDATNVVDGATNTGLGSEDEGTFTTGGPGIESESVANVTSTSATLQAAINPHNGEASVTKGAIESYSFQYSTSRTEGCTPATCPVVPALPASLGVGEAALRVAQHVPGLSPAAVYHYRVIALSEPKSGEQETFYGADRTFTTQAVGAFALPDGRQWELVSPPDKHGALIEPIKAGWVIQAAANGQAMTYVTDAPTEAVPQGYTNFVQVLSTRGGSGWSSRDIAIPHENATGLSVGEGQEYRLFSEDLSLSIMHPLGPFEPLSPEATEQTAYLRTDYLNGNINEPCLPAVMRCYRPLVTANNVSSSKPFGGGDCNPFCGPKVEGATPDLSHVALGSNVPLTSTPGDEGGLYEWSPSGQLQLISILPNGQPASIASSRPGLGSIPSGTNDANARHAVSLDGSRVIWHEETGNRHLYMRDTVKGQTVQLDEGLTGEPEFQTASSDGSRVFFTDAGDLYEYSAERSELVALTKGAAVQGLVAGASEDGSYAYFVANASLAPGAVSGNCAEGNFSSLSTCNLYVRRYNGVEWEAPSLVAVLSGADNSDFASKGLVTLTARVSPDGHWLAFMSQRSLTGYDNRDAVSGKPDEEVYLYHADAAKLVCASCNPSGAEPNGVEYQNVNDKLVGGDGVWDSKSWLAANVPGWTPFSLGVSRYQSRYLSDSGRLFFNSNDALVPQDVNGTWDVYQYEPPGVGGCTALSTTFSQRSGGCVGLTSSGSSPEESAFLDASESGGDVFFLTAARLARQDFDTALDVYDAHECTTSSPCFPVAPPPPPPCSTEGSCRGTSPPQPNIFGSPASATFFGPGNSSPPPVQTAETRAQKLAKALSACRKRYKRSRQRMGVCERQARRRYGPVKRARKASERGRR